MGKTITLNVSLRLFVASITVAGLLFGWALLLVMHDEQNLRSYLQHAHSSRVADQKRTDREIDQLACYIVADIKDSAAPIVPKVRRQYGCPPYGKDPNFNLYKPRHKTKTPAKTTSSSSAKQGRHGSRTVSSSRGRTGGGGHPSVGPSTSASSSPTPGGPTSSPPTRSPSAPPQRPIISVPVSVPPIITTGPVRIGGTCAVQVGRTCVAAE